MLLWDSSRATALQEELAMHYSSHFLLCLFLSLCCEPAARFSGFLPHLGVQLSAEAVQAACPLSHASHRPLWTRGRAGLLPGPLMATETCLSSYILNNQILSCFGDLGAGHVITFPSLRLYLSAFLLSILRDQRGCGERELCHLSFFLYVETC